VRNSALLKATVFALLAVTAMSALLLTPTRFGYRNLQRSWKLLRSWQDPNARVALYVGWHLYDRAVHASLNELRDGPEDASVYDQIAMVYLIRAQVEKNQQWVDQAIKCIDKELAAYRRWGDPDPGFALLRAGIALEAAGEISARQRCTYYHRAVEVLQEAAAASQGDQVILRGEPIPLAPQRTAISKALSRIESRQGNARCEFM
jgi:tetratricopeptide (TPR) repeat protein